MKKRTHPGRPAIILGLILILAAALLTSYNILQSRRAAAVSDRMLNAVQLQTEAYFTHGEIPETNDEAEEIPQYILTPEIEMPVITIDGNDYIGTLDIPALGLSLPILSEWSNSLLQIAPCRYSGSAYLNDLVLSAHNYSGHFGRLSTLSDGDLIRFTDAAGNVFTYRVCAMEVLGAYDTEEMLSGDWDLTLFTCTLGGRSRFTLRCERMDA